MKNVNKKTIQISLVIIGFILIAVTYFIYPRLIQKTSKTVDATKTEIDKEADVTSFTNVEYRGLTNDGSTYVIHAEKAKIEPNDPDIVHMNFIIAKFYYEDGRIIVITSDIGQFNKFNGNIKFQKNIKMVDNEDNKLTSENLDMLISEDYAAAYNNVMLVTQNGQYVIADKILFDATKKTFKISMFEENDDIKLKLIK